MRKDFLFDGKNNYAHSGARSRGIAIGTWIEDEIYHTDGEGKNMSSGRMPVSGRLLSLCKGTL